MYRGYLGVSQKAQDTHERDYSSINEGNQSQGRPRLKDEVNQYLGKISHVDCKKMGDVRRKSENEKREGKKHKSSNKKTHVLEA
jgi:hypothetical protein